MQKRQWGKKSSDDQHLPSLVVSVKDVVTLAMTGEDEWLILGIKGWPEKKDPKCCYCVVGVALTVCAVGGS